MLKIQLCPCPSAFVKSEAGNRTERRGAGLGEHGQLARYVCGVECSLRRLCGLSGFVEMGLLWCLVEGERRDANPLGDCWAVNTSTRLRGESQLDYTRKLKQKKMMVKKKERRCAIDRASR